MGKLSNASEDMDTTLQSKSTTQHKRSNSLQIADTTVARHRTNRANAGQGVERLEMVPGTKEYTSVRHKNL